MRPPPHHRRYPLLTAYCQGGAALSLPKNIHLQQPTTAYNNRQQTFTLFPTTGTLYFDDFESRSLSYIGVLTSPYTPPEPSVAPAYLASVYDYGDPLQPGNPQPNQPHAVKFVDHPTGTPDASYTYDNNGNMIERVEDGTTWTLTYNEENRLESVSAVILSQTNEWISTYDGNGTRVKQVYKINSVVQTTNYYYMGGIYEVEDDGTTQTATRYYGIGGERVAMHDGTTLSYFLTDKQGSTIAVLDTGGTILSEQRYKPFGEVRDDVGTITETDFGYTGQRGMDVATTDLMDYNARFYEPSLGRFTQPDTIIPDPNNPQTLNRYAYVTNNPARYIDPSEHGQCQDVKDEDCSGRSKVDCDISPEYCPPDDPRFWELWHQANELLNLFASGDIDSLEVMARIVEAAAGIYGDDKNSFMKALGWIFIGTQELGFGTLRSAISNPNQCAGIGRAESDCPRDIIHLDDSGFHEDFQDEGQQLFHAWAYFAQLFSANPAAALEADAGNIWHEGVEGALGHDGASLQDYKLSVVAGKLGQMFYVGAVSMEDLGDEIRYWFGESGPGAWGMAFVGPGTILR